MCLVYSKSGTRKFKQINQKFSWNGQIINQGKKYIYAYKMVCKRDNCYYPQIFNLHGQPYKLGEIFISSREKQKPRKDSNDCCGKTYTDINRGIHVYLKRPYLDKEDYISGVRIIQVKCLLEDLVGVNIGLTQAVFMKILPTKELKLRG